MTDRSDRADLEPRADPIGSAAASGRSSALIVFIAALGAVAALAGPSFPPEDPELASARTLIDEGDLEGAILALDALTRRIGSDGARSQDASRAYLYLGVAYVGLGQEHIARAKFRQALLRDRGLRLSPEEFSARAIRIFEEQRKALEATATLEKQAKKKGRKGAVLLLSLGGAGAAGVAVALGGERQNRPPAGAFSIAPEGVALVSATTMTFTATATDPEGEPLSFEWDFGDGDGTRGAEGPVATHVYSREGTFEVKLTIRDGLTSTTATGRVTARTLTGRWRVAGQLQRSVAEYGITQRGNRLNLLVTYQEGSSKGPALFGQEGGGVADPRRVQFGHGDCSGPGDSSVCVTLSGEADSALQSIVGVATCQLELCSVAGAGSNPVTLTRQ